MNATNLYHPIEFRTSQFQFNRGTEVFTADASDFGPGAFQAIFTEQGRVYNDSCDVGFTLVSSKTGKKIIFVLAHTENDRDGDTQYWEFTPAVGPAIAFTHIDLRVRVFND